jgi:putative membrane protein
MYTMVRQYRSMLAGIGLALGLAAVPALSLSAQQHQNQRSSDVKADSAFVTEAASGGMMEVQLGQLTQKQATSSAVKQFGQRMVTDHSKANKQLEKVASQGGLTPPAELMPKHQQAVSQLSSKSGSEFDKAYMSEMVKDHAEDVRKFEDASKSAHSEAVRKFAKQTMPTLEKHLSLAKRVAGQVGADTTAVTMSAWKGR